RWEKDPTMIRSVHQDDGKERTRHEEKEEKGKRHEEKEGKGKNKDSKNVESLQPKPKDSTGPGVIGSVVGSATGKSSSILSVDEDDDDVFVRHAPLRQHGLQHRSQSGSRIGIPVTPSGAPLQKARIPIQGATLSITGDRRLTRSSGKPN